MAIKRQEKVRDIIGKHGRAATINVYDGLKWPTDYIDRMVRIKKDGARKIRREEDRVDTNYFRFMDPVLDIAGQELM